MLVQKLCDVFECILRDTPLAEGAENDLMASLSVKSVAGLK